MSNETKKALNENECVQYAITFLFFFQVFKEIIDQVRSNPSNS